MIIAVGAWRGTGATVVAFALAAAAAAADPDGAWLIEADPAGGVLAGRVQLGQFALAGLEQVAFPTERGAVISTLHEVSQRVGDVSVVAAPADPFRAFACHQPRVPWVSALRELPGTVVVDVGRLRAGSPAWPLLQLADEMLLVSSPEVTAVVASDDWARNGGRVSPSEAGIEPQRCRLVIVDSPAGVAFPSSTLAADLGTTCAGRLPWEPSAVDLLYRGASLTDRRLRKSQFASAVRRLAANVAAPQLVAS
ncbi:MAG: hypothetical protein Q7V57_08030 [Actinomycetota bacterium]|nr:hypothetical protein [Actinomycetota bacterium]